MTLNISSVFTYDEDAGNYIQAVEAADGQVLEGATRKAINNFVIGCKQDGVWDAIKASCILAGARTLNGALVPLAGAAPTNYNFVSGDYNRKTGLVGNGSTKSLDSNRAANADSNDNYHQSVYITTVNSIATAFSHNYIGSIASSSVRGLVTLSSTGKHGIVSNGTTVVEVGTLPLQTGFFGQSKANATLCIAREAMTNTSITGGLGTFNIIQNTFVFQRGDGRHVNARLAFYSIGESLDLALLDARVTDLITAFGAAVP